MDRKVFSVKQDAFVNPIAPQPRPPRKDYAKLFSIIAEEINNNYIGHTYHVVEPEPGVRKILLEHASGTVMYVVEDAVTSDILKFTEAHPKFGFVHQNAMAAMKYWLFIAKTIPEPKIVKMRTEEGLCFHRLAFDPDEKMDTPLWDKFLERTSNREALKVFIGSLFIEEADRQQYVWLYGQGLNGKGTLLRFLDKCLGISFFSTEPPTRDDKFWNYNLLGKRLVAFPDINNAHFPASQKFKMLSGDDKVSIEPKGKQAYNAKLSCKFIFASNERPDISAQKSDMRRAIFCEIGEIEKVEPKFEDKFWMEAPGIIGKCIMAYKDKCGEHGPIPTESEGLDTLVDENSGFYELMFHQSFEEEPNRNLPFNDQYRIDNKRFMDIMLSWKAKKETVRGFKKYLEAKYKICYRPYLIKGTRKQDRAWIGMRSKITTEIHERQDCSEITL